jgi:hypothetical protein
VCDGAIRDGVALRLGGRGPGFANRTDTKLYWHGPTLTVFAVFGSFDGATVLVGVVFGGFGGVVSSVQPVSVGDVGVVRRSFVIAGFMVCGGFAMMGRGVFVVFRGLAMVFCTCVCSHEGFLFVAMTESPNAEDFPAPVNSRIARLQCGS